LRYEIEGLESSLFTFTKAVFVFSMLDLQLFF